MKQAFDVWSFPCYRSYLQTDSLSLAWSIRECNVFIQYRASGTLHTVLLSMGMSDRQWSLITSEDASVRGREVHRPLAMVLRSLYVPSMFFLTWGIQLYVFLATQISTGRRCLQKETIIIVVKIQGSFVFIFLCNIYSEIHKHSQQTSFTKF